MLCPKNPMKSFDDLECQDCNRFLQCFKMWREGDNFSNNKAQLKSDPKKNKNPITRKEIEKFKIDLGYIIFFSDWEKKLLEEDNKKN